VAFAVGSDAGGRVHPHGRLGREIVLLVQECGFSVEAAIRAATSSAAEAAWLPDAGTIRAGGIADLLAVRGDLTSKIEELEDPTGVALVAQRGQFVVDRRPLAVAVPA
jgi:imidazolonepropionase-like amidohydrolase